LEEAHPRLGLRRRGGRSREALIAMFLAASFGMMALLSIRVLPQLGRLLLPQAGEPRPTAPPAATIPPPAAAPLIAPATGALSGEFGLLTRPIPSVAPHPRASHPPHTKPPGRTVTAVQGGVSQGTHYSTTKIKGLVPPPHPIKQPTGDKEEATGLQGKGVGGDKDEDQQSGTGKGSDGQLNGKGSGGGGST